MRDRMRDSYTEWQHQLDGGSSILTFLKSPQWPKTSRLGRERKPSYHHVRLGAWRAATVWLIMRAATGGTRRKGGREREGEGERCMILVGGKACRTKTPRRITRRSNEEYIQPANLVGLLGSEEGRRGFPLVPVVGAAYSGITYIYSRLQDRRYYTLYPPRRRQ